MTLPYATPNCSFRQGVGSDGLHLCYCYATMQHVVRAISSVGQSASFTRMRSVVRAHYRPPFTTPKGVVFLCLILQNTSKGITVDVFWLVCADKYRSLRDTLLSRTEDAEGAEMFFGWCVPINTVHCDMCYGSRGCTEARRRFHGQLSTARCYMLIVKISACAVD